MSDQSEDRNKQQSCDRSLSRSEFIRSVLKRGAIAGGLLAAPKVLDKFLIPAAWAFGSSCATVAEALADTNYPAYTPDTQQNNSTEKTTASNNNIAETQVAGTTGGDSICGQGAAEVA